MTKYSDKIKLWITFAISVGVLVALDLWLKVWSVSNLQNNPPRTLIYGLLGLRYYENTGMAFGLLSGHDWSAWLISLVKIAALIALLMYYHRLPPGKKYWYIRIPLIMIFAGGVGNLFDRITLGAVRDMLEFLFINFAIFNLADVFIVLGAISWAVFELFIVKTYINQESAV